jgi:TP901 family phage tail tape measure protein
MAETEELGLEVAVEGFRRFMSQMDDMDRAIGGTEKSWGGMSGAAGIATVALGNLAARGIELVVEGLVRMGEGLVAVTAESVGMAADFQEQMAILEVAARGSNLAFDDYHDIAIKVGGDTQLVGASASDAAEVMTILTKSGMSTGEMFGDLNGYMAGTAELGGAVRAAIDLAAASTLDQAQAAELSTVVLATWGGELETEAERAEFLNQAMNNIVQTADASNAEVNDLAEAYRNVGPSAAAAGIPIEQTNAFLAILSTRGIKGAEAGTQLKSMFTNLTRPTAQVTGALNELGVELYDAEGNMREWPDILADMEKALYGVSEVTVVVGGRTAEQNHQLDLAQRAYQQATDALYKHSAGISVLSDKQLEKYITQQAAANAEIAQLESITGEATTATKQLTEAERNEYIQTLAGSYGKNALISLLEEGTEGYEEMTAATAEAATLQEQMAARTATYNGQLEAMRGTVETLKIAIGEKFLPVLTEMVQGFAGFIEEHGPQIEAMFGRLGTFLSEELPPIFEGIVNFFINDLPGGIETAVGFWEGTLLPAFENARAFIQENILPVLAQFGEWLQLALPLAIQIATDYFNNYLLPVINSLVEQWETKLQPALAGLWSWLQEVIPPAIEFLTRMWNEYLAPALAAVGQFMAETLIPLLGTLVSWLIEHIPVAVETLVSFWTGTLQPALETVWAFIQDNVIPIFETVRDWLAVKLAEGTEKLSDIWQNTLQPALEIVWEFLNESVFPLLKSIQEFLDTVFGLALTVFAGIWQNVLQPALQEAWRLFDEKILPVLTAVWEFIKDKVQPIIQGFVDGALADLQRSLGYISDAFSVLKGWIDDVTAALQNVEVPEWMKGDSPPPLYHSLNYISEAMRHLSQVELPRLRVGFDLPPMSDMMASVSSIAPPGVGGSSATNINQDNRQFNLTTQSTTQPGGLALEFAFMESASR